MRLLRAGHGSARPLNCSVSRQMNTSAQIGIFEVTSHYELVGRGGFVIGHIRNGVLRPGMRVATHREPAVLTVSGIEFLDNPSERVYRNALVFAERPTLDFVRAAFPVGSMLEACAPAATENERA